MASKSRHPGFPRCHHLPPHRGRTGIRCNFFPPRSSGKFGSNLGAARECIPGLNYGFWAENHLFHSISMFQLSFFASLCTTTSQSVQTLMQMANKVMRDKVLAAISVHSHLDRNRGTHGAVDFLGMNRADLRIHAGLPNGDTGQTYNSQHLLHSKPCDLTYGD